MLIEKRDGTLQPYNHDQITIALRKSAKQIGIQLPDTDLRQILDDIDEQIAKADNLSATNISVNDIHNIVVRTTNAYNREIATSYRNFRNHKIKQNERIAHLMNIYTDQHIEDEKVESYQQQAMEMQTKYPNEPEILIYLRLLDDAVYKNDNEFVAYLLQGEAND